MWLKDDANGLDLTRRVVLPDIVVGARLLVLPGEAFEAGVWHVFLVSAWNTVSSSPDTLRFN